MEHETKPAGRELVSRQRRKNAQNNGQTGEVNSHSSHREPQTRWPAQSIIGNSPACSLLKQRVETFAQSDAPVLVTGESGAGKEVVARCLHRASPRGRGPFVAINCAAFPESLLESELFGHERGAFTGAFRQRDGRFVAADGGAIFLDEVAEMPPAAQVKLLRVLETKLVEPLGTNRSIQIDVRIISATNRDLKQRIKEGLFREDLFYRLNVLDIRVPPLRERPGDISSLVRYILAQLSGGSVPTIAPQAWAAILQYDYPGNVRELEHALERASLLAGGHDIDLAHLPDAIAGTERIPQRLDQGLLPLHDALREFEKEYLIRVLRATEWKKGQAAKLLGISRKHLWEKLRSHGVKQAPQILAPNEQSR